MTTLLRRKNRKSTIDCVIPIVPVLGIGVAHTCDVGAIDDNPDDRYSMMNILVFFER